jgi:hypothetical protein
MDLELPDGRKGILKNAKAYGTDLRLSLIEKKGDDLIAISARAVITFIDDVKVEEIYGSKKELL